MNEVKFYFNLIKKIPLIYIYKKFDLPFVLPYIYRFDITYKCDSKCKTCYIWKQKVDTKKEIKLEEFKKIIKNVKDDVIVLILSGGQPILREDFSGFIKIASDMCKNLYQINIDINGLNSNLIKERISKALDTCSKDINFVVVVSLDGLGKVHDDIRGIFKAYEKTLKTIKVLKDLQKNYKNLKVEIQLIISKFNIYHIKEFLENISELGINVHSSFALEGDVFKNINSNIEVKYDKNLEELIKYLYKRIKLISMYNFIERIFLKLHLIYFRENIQILPCYASYSSITIDNNCNIKICDTHPKINSLKKFDYDIKTALKDDNLKFKRKEVKNNGCSCMIDCEFFLSVIQNFPLALYKYINAK